VDVEQAMPTLLFLLSWARNAAMETRSEEFS
jgi:hypothetical protein